MDFSHFCLWILYYQIFHNVLKFTTDGQQNQTSHEPRSRAFYYSINSLLHKRKCYYTEPPMKVPITPHHLKYSYYGPPPIVIALGSFSRFWEAWKWHSYCPPLRDLGVRGVSIVLMWTLVFDWPELRLMSQVRFSSRSRYILGSGVELTE